MMANPRILGYLGRALSHELSAVQQYLTHAGLADLWGLTEVGAHFRREAAEEQEHAERLTARMLRLGAMPNGSRLRPVQAGFSLIELLEADRRLEWHAVALYHAAANYCALIGDVAGRDFFAALHDAELTHARELEDWIGRLDQTRRRHSTWR